MDNERPRTTVSDMLRLMRRCPPPLRGLCRGFAAAPIGTPQDVAEERKKQIMYYDRINRKTPRHAMVSQEAFDRVTRFLMDRGFSHLQALRAISLHVTVEWLSNLGLSHDKINDIIRRHPNILGTSFDKFEAFAGWYISKGVPKNKIAYVFNVFPQGLSHNISTSLESKVEFLKEIGCSDKQITSVLMLAPQIFTNSVEGLRAKANYLVELGITRELLPCIVARVPTCLGMNSARIKETADALDEMFGAGAGIRAMTLNCIIVMYNIDGMRESFEYLISLGFTRERIGENTRFITRNVSRFLRPRAQFLAGNGHSLTGNTSWILMPEGLFIKKYPDYEAYLADYKAKEKQKINA